jgi:hypothetical protein
MPRPKSLLGQQVDGLIITGVSMMHDRVSCECADPACRCGGICQGLAIYQWGSMAEAGLQYLCLRCAQRMVERGTGRVDREEVAGDA